MSAVPPQFIESLHNPQPLPDREPAPAPGESDEPDPDTIYTALPDDERLISVNVHLLFHPGVKERLRGDLAAGVVDAIRQVVTDLDPEP